MLDDLTLRREVFQHKWGLTQLLGAPKKPAFYLVGLSWHGGVAGCACALHLTSAADLLPVCRRLHRAPLYRSTSAPGTICS